MSTQTQLPSNAHLSELNNFGIEIVEVEEIVIKDIHAYQQTVQIIPDQHSATLCSLSLAS